MDKSSVAESSDTSISTASLNMIIDKLKNDQHRNTTKKSYYNIWKGFNQFFVRLDEKPNSWEDRLILFVGHLIQKSRKSTTIRSYVSAIRAVLAADGITLNENKFLLSSLTRACKLTNDKVKIRLPIQKGMLSILVKEVDDYYSQKSQPFLATLYSAMFTAAFYGMLRVGEVTSGSHPIQARDVHIAANKCKILFILRSLKTHGKESKPQMVKISSLKEFNVGACPFRRLKAYLAVRGGFKMEEEPFFIFADGSPVAPWNARSTLKKMIQRCNLPNNAYDFHSFRVGQATSLMNSGKYSVETIKKLGRWKSNAVFLYLR